MKTNASFEREVEWIVLRAQSSEWTSQGLSSFVPGRGVTMDDVQNEERAEQIAAVFALLTAKLEDAAGFAADGQAPGSYVKLLELARQIAELAGEAATISGVLAVLFQSDRATR